MHLVRHRVEWEKKNRLLKICVHSPRFKRRTTAIILCVALQTIVLSATVMSRNNILGWLR